MTVSSTSSAPGCVTPNDLSANRRVTPKAAHKKLREVELEAQGSEAVDRGCRCF